MDSFMIINFELNKGGWEDSFAISPATDDEVGQRRGEIREAF